MAWTSHSSWGRVILRMHEQAVVLALQVRCMDNCSSPTAPRKLWTRMEQGFDDLGMENKRA